MSKLSPLELWGGLECTVARVGDLFRNQSVETGHHVREDDLDRIAELGVRTLRYPIVWETVSPDAPDVCDWEWHDRRLNRLRELGIRPIAGLIHHGSGPHYTNLLDPNFPKLFATHAARVAERYPWIEFYTPVNEPLTTARFSALYGHWYPHGTGYESFLQALVNQCLAVVLAMQAIRQVNPTAKLVQTEDFGKTFSTPALAYQADHENERRWLSFDLLFGRVDRKHPWWGMFTWYGVSEATLDFIVENATPPDILGINHYLTSERYLDQRAPRYPQHHWGHNGQEPYADVEAVRIQALDDLVGPAERLREVWDRYHTPIAVTEVHHGCTRDEQLRWLAEVWTAVETVRAEGADVRAVTIWSLVGTVDWNSLLTRQAGIYEPGAFDVRSSPPRPTALAVAARSFAENGRFEHPVLDRPGWWRRDSRFYVPLNRREAARRKDSPRPILILGRRSALAEAFSRLATVRGLDHLSLRERDLARLGSVIERERPWAVVDLGGGPIRAVPPAELAARCHSEGLRYMTCSEAPVFDGALGRPAVESDPVCPIAPKGREAAAREAAVRNACPDALVIRTGPLFGPWRRESDPFRLLAALAGGEPVTFAEAETSPTYLPDMIHSALDLLIDGEVGLRHLANGGSVSEAMLARELAARTGLPAPEIGEVGSGPSFALATERGELLPPLASALDRFVRDCEPDWRLAEGAAQIAAE